jgi:transposase
MNGERYQEVLTNHLIPFMLIHGITYFLQDSAPCHTSKRIKDYLSDKPFHVIDWPGNSPDLNPIENCWSYIKDKDIGSVPKLIKELKILWTSSISREYFKKLSDSMPSRIQQVIAPKGEATKY